MQFHYLVLTVIYSLNNIFSINKGKAEVFLLWLTVRSAMLRPDSLTLQVTY
jgi:hypothetical protein